MHDLVVSYGESTTIFLRSAIPWKYFCSVSELSFLLAVSSQVKYTGQLSANLNWIVPRKYLM